MLILILHTEAWESGGEVQLLRFLGQVAPFLQDENYMFVQKQKQKLPLWFIWASQVAGVVSAGDKTGTGLILRLERSPGGGHGDPLQYCCLENSCGTEELGGLQSIGSQSQTRLKGLSMHACAGLFIHSNIQFLIQQIIERFICVGAVQVLETQG